MRRIEAKQAARLTSDPSTLLDIEYVEGPMNRLGPYPLLLVASPIDLLGSSSSLLVADVTWGQLASLCELFANVHYFAPAISISYRSYQVGKKKGGYGTAHEYRVVHPVAATAISRQARASVL
jgi:hypothetical protein